MTRQEIETNNEPKATDGKVGYKHPPVKSQFRKGQSGNITLGALPFLDLHRPARAAA
jgi:hypothetical protein